MASSLLWLVSNEINKKKRHGQEGFASARFLISITDICDINYTCIPF
jgi:hypothetical protein